MLLHGGGQNRTYWHSAGYVARLKDAYRVIAIDARGSGDSDRPADPSAYTTQTQGDDVLAVADACGLDRFFGVIRTAATSAAISRRARRA